MYLKIISFADTYAILCQGIENTINYLENTIYYADFSNISLIGHSTGGGSAHLYCSRINCNSLILQDPFFVPLLEELETIDLVTDSYFIYSEDWYNGYEDINELSEIEVYRDYVTNKGFANGFYMTQSAHYDFIAFGAISPLAKYTLLKGRIDYKDSFNNKEIIVYTSGLGGLFKPGIPIGKIDDSSDGQINFFSDFTQLNYVKIVSYKFGGEK